MWCERPRTHLLAQHWNKDPGSVWLSLMQVQTQCCPMGHSNMGFFFSSQTCHILSVKGEIKGRLSPKKGGGAGGGWQMCSFTQLFSYLSKRTRVAACRTPELSFAFLTSIYILFVTYSTPEPSLSSLSRTNVLAGRSLSSRFRLGHLSRGDSLHGYFWRLGKHCVLFIKTHIQWGLIRLTG